MIREGGECRSASLRAVREKLFIIRPAQIRGQAPSVDGERADDEEDVELRFVSAFLDFETKGVDPRKLASALCEVSRGMGMCYGSFGSLDDKHVTFVVGLPGSSVNAVPATMLADTIAYALNGAAAAKEHFDRVFAVEKSRRRG